MEDDDYSTSVFENMYIGNHWHSGEFGHLTIHPDGDTCYCGKKGCVDAYCSALRLSKETDGQLEQFFVELEKENPEIRKAWDTYLEDLSIAVDNLRMCFDCEVVLGGYVGSCMKPYISELRDKVARRNIFEGAGDYISVCTFQNEASALGAAVFYIEDFMNSI